MTESAPQGEAAGAQGEAADPASSDSAFFPEIEVTTPDLLLLVGLAMAAVPTIRKTYLLIDYRLRRRRISRGDAVGGKEMRREELNAAHGAYQKALEKYSGWMTGLQVGGLLIVALQILYNVTH